MGCGSFSIDVHVQCDSCGGSLGTSRVLVGVTGNVKSLRLDYPEELPPEGGRLLHRGNGWVVVCANCDRQ